MEGESDATTLLLVDPGSGEYCDNTHGCQVAYTAIEPGFQLQLYAPAGERLHSTPRHLNDVTVATAEDVTSNTTLLALAQALPGKMSAALKLHFVSIASATMRVVRVTATAAISPPSPTFAYVQVADLGGAGTVVRNSRFVDSYDNCMRIQSINNTVVENNLFVGASHGLSIMFDESFLEGALGIRGVQVINNTFVNVTDCTGDHDCIDTGPLAQASASGNKYEPSP